MKNRLLTLKFVVIILTLMTISCNSKVQNETLTEENYLHEDSLLWINFEKETEGLIAILDSLPNQRDSIINVYNVILEKANQKNIELAFKYACTPSGLQRLFMVRNHVSKDSLAKVLNTLPEEMQKSEAGLNIKAHLETEQLAEGDALYAFPCQDEEGEAFNWETLKGKQVLLLYGGLGCMGSEGRKALKHLYEQTSRKNLEIIVYWPSSSLEKLQAIRKQFPSDYIFISDFKQDASPMKIKYGCQATPTCFLTDKKHQIVVKSEGLNMDAFNKHIHFK
jgi:peroxiredoxin